MTKPAVPRELLDPVVEYFKPQRVILFGSRARGEATRNSDIDLLVVVDDGTPSEKLTWKAGYQAHRSSHAAHGFPSRPQPFKRNRHVVPRLTGRADAHPSSRGDRPPGARAQENRSRARNQRPPHLAAAGRAALNLTFPPDRREYGTH